MSQWIGLIGALGGVAIGGAVSYLVNWQKFKYEKSHIKEKRSLDKLETGYQLLIEIEKWYTDYHAYNLSLFISKGEDSVKPENKIPFSELEMVFALYIPTLKSRAEELKKICQEHGSVSIKVYSMPPVENSERQSLFSELCESNDKVIKKISELKTEFAEYAEQYLE